MTKYLKVADITGTLEGHLQNHFNLLALFERVSKHGTNENCLPVFTWIFKAFSTGSKQESRQSGTLLMRTSCRGKQTSWLSIQKNNYIIQHQVCHFQCRKILVVVCIYLLEIFLLVCRLMDNVVMAKSVRRRYLQMVNILCQTLRKRSVINPITVGKFPGNQCTLEGLI